ncbi:olfactory receptor 13D1-like [Rhinatrema bivittatum]|uniref:olfactory receptor 13D1-like n=1 Tax=Rhinatrema bivittatum TaxID=194408 RepID=UPI00112872AB|nr:olfactory receptor 13D1-like [Rhinatrema bivittatum]
MQSGNQTQVTEFLILGIPEYPNLQVLFFVVFLSIYLVTVMGNLIILALMSIDLRLHKPMYFFLSNLALLDICLTSSTIPKMLAIFLMDNKAISFKACMVQLYLLMSFLSVEFYLLTAMAYDRYVAICNPLHYAVVMNKRVCVLLSAGSWIIGFLDPLPHSVSISHFSFCGENIINHLFCDFQTMLKLSCSDTSTIRHNTAATTYCQEQGFVLYNINENVDIFAAFIPRNPYQAISTRDMEWENQTQVTEFLILGIPEYPELQSLLFVVFLSIYLVTLMGNLAILTLMSINSHLHKPMYFFLGNLAFVDICLTSCALPKMLAIFLMNNKAISFQACMAQLYLLMAFLSVEFFLLTAMAYDRYVAICNPLHYTVVMNKRVCILLSAVSWIIGFLDPLPHRVTISHLSFCGHNVVNHLFCDFQTMLKLSCSDISIIKLTMLTLNLGLALGAILLILTSYVQIILAILKIQSMEGRQSSILNEELNCEMLDF